LDHGAEIVFKGSWKIDGHLRIGTPLDMVISLSPITSLIFERLKLLTKNTVLKKFHFSITDKKQVSWNFDTTYLWNK